MFRLSMDTIDQADDYRRLQDLYGDMSDGRLLEMAEGIDDLTEIAQTVLRAEIAKRRLGESEPDAAFSPPPISPDEVVGVWEVNDAAEAETVIAVLESAGIPAIPGSRKYELVDGGFEEQLDVRVVPAFVPAALEVLREHFPRQPEAEATDKDAQLALCPSCRSPEILLEGLAPASASGGAKKFHWICEACGHQWTD